MDHLQLKIIGYRHSFQEPDYPDPAWFIDSTWSHFEKEQVLIHLSKGQRTPSIHLGSSWCRFRGGVKSLGDKEFTDGHFVWPEGLAHYIEHHNVCLPSEVVNSMLCDPLLRIHELTDIDFTNVDYEWWKGQRGWNRLQRSFMDILDIGQLTIVQTDPNNLMVKKDLLKEFLFKAQDVSEKLKQIERVLKGENVTLKGRFKDYELFKVRANKVGLETEFVQMNFNEHCER